MEILLTQGKVAIIDDEDATTVAPYKWHARNSRNEERWYAATKRDGEIILMHRLLTGHFRTDHRDGDGLNNRRLNLRPCTNSQNCANQRKRKNTTSRFKGVSWGKRESKWRVHIRKDGVLKSLGSFDEEEVAAAAYQTAAVEAFGEFARF